MVENSKASDEILKLLKNEGHFEQILKASIAKVKGVLYFGDKPIIQVDLIDSDSRV